jgi:hypothetical protein
VAGELREEVDVPGHRLPLGDHGHRVPELGQHLEAAAGDSEAALDRLNNFKPAQDIPLLLVHLVDMWKKSALTFGHA